MTIKRKMKVSAIGYFAECYRDAENATFEEASAPSAVALVSPRQG